MQDGDNFFTEMDRSLRLEQQQQREQEEEEERRRRQQQLERERRDEQEAAAAKLEASEKEAEKEETRVGYRQHGGGEQAGGGIRTEEESLPPLPPPLPAPREVNPLDEIDFKAVPADPMTVAETLVEVREVLLCRCGGWGTSLPLLSHVFMVVGVCRAAWFLLSVHLHRVSTVYRTVCTIP